MLHKFSRKDLQIHLNEIPEQGRDYHYTQTTAELSESLQDIIGQRPYDISFHLKPIGSAFEIRGRIKTAMELSCSRCAFDFEYAVDEPINEILMVEGDRPRGSKSTRANHSSEWVSDGPFCNYLNSPIFDVASYIHELIAAAEPLQPRPKEGCGDDCPHLLAAEAAGRFGHAGQLEGSEKSPFAVLADLGVAKRPSGH